MGIRLRFIVFFILSGFFIWLDQITKKMAVKHLMHQSEKVLIPDILEFRYLENRGAAFGILQGGHILFYIVAVIVIVAIFYIIYRMPASKRFFPLFICLMFIFSGAIGNQIDRVLQGYVVDFIYFSFINFPIFNIADIYVSMATISLAILLIFVYKEEELRFVGLG